MKLPISVVVITLNEAKNMEDCLESVCGWADEIIVVDSFSMDKTLEIAARYTQKIYQHPFENFAQQRNWAQDCLPIKNEWVFHLDADERTSRELTLQLKKIFASRINCEGFMMPRRTIFRSRWIKFGGHYPVYHLRLFNKRFGRSEQRIYDQNYVVEGKVSRIEGDIINIINPELRLWKERHKKWAILEAKEVLFNKDRILNLKFMGTPIEMRNWLRYKIYYNLPLFVRPFIYFFYRYILRLGFLDCLQGLVFHFYHGFWYRVIVDIEIYKLKGKKWLF